ncbi:lipid storage droplets surface-binding protein 2 isoform X2 [Eurosta solidaginis]|uniref:lipid storage droplets surface-binding protein 2 isoform X2 n=1 Tax=Eurosta solidaginis TaxID=178769 RepID=UPI00353156FA
MATSADQSKTNVTGANGALALEQGKDVQTLLPHLESLERIIKLPVVNAALDKSQDVYQNVKGRNRVFNWALNAAEDCVSRAVVTAAPIVSKLDRPIQYVDQTLVKGIDKLEVTAPIIKETPQEMYNQAKSKVVEVVQPHFERVSKLKSAGQQKAASLKDLAWAKANEVLATHYGSIAVSGVDATTALAERLLEYYFPRSDDDSEDYSVPVSANEDPVLHSVQTVGRLSHKISRRVYRNVSRQIKRMQQGNLNDYLSSLVAALKLHQYINFINSSMGTNIEQSTLTDVSPNVSGSNNSTPNNSTKVVAVNSRKSTTTPTSSTTSATPNSNSNSATKRSKENKTNNSTSPKEN